MESSLIISLPLDMLLASLALYLNDLKIIMRFLKIHFCVILDQEHKSLMVFFFQSLQPALSSHEIQTFKKPDFHKVTVPPKKQVIGKTIEVGKMNKAIRGNTK